MIEFRTKAFAYAISEKAENLYFKDLRDGKNHLSKEPSPSSYVTLKDETVVPAVSATFHAPILSLTYENGLTAAIEVCDRGDYFIFTLKEVSSEDFLKIAFVNIPIDIDYHQYIANREAPELFTATMMGLTCATRMAEHPGRNLTLRAEGYPKIGLKGTRGHSDRPVRAAVFGAPDGKIRDIMKRVMDEIPDGELPKSKKGGPYAMDYRDARRTYMGCPSALRLEDAPAYIEKCKKLGVTQVGFHQGGGYIQGDFRLNPDIFPNGESDLKKLIDMFHEAGILVAVHSYTFFVAHNSKYLTPVPHEDLDAIVRLTLAEPLDETATEIRILEAPDGVSEIYAEGLVSSPYLKIGKELIKFGKVRHEKPYAFIECKRGALGTAISSHEAGEEVRQLKEYFYFVLPKADSPLFYEVAKNTADFYNKFGFDGFYMDAIDGVFAMEGNEYAWYYATEFITEVCNHLDHDPLFDCCYNPQYTGSWYARSRYGALDLGNRSLRNFIDAHVYYDDTTAERMYMAPELGWFDFCSRNWYKYGWQNRVMREEDVEYLFNRVVANDACFSYYGGVRQELGVVPLLDRILPIIHRYEGLRSQLNLTPEECRLLRTPGNEYSLRTDKDKPYFLESKTLRLFEDATHKELKAVNPFTEKKPTLRLYALTGAADFNSEDAISLITPPDAPLSSHNEFDVRVEGAPINAKKNNAVGFTLVGDGSGATVRVRLQSTLEGLPVGLADYHVKVDFVGPRYFAFYETENADDPTNTFPAPKLIYRVFTDVRTFYSSYRNLKVFDSIDTLIVDIEGAHSDIRLGEVKLLLPRKIAYENPSVTIGGKTVSFPCTLESMQAIECDADGNAQVVSATGTVLQELPKVDMPTLPAGESTVTVCPGTKDPEARSELVLHFLGDNTL